ncbi:hypothetical protein DSS3P8_180 [Roseobacter phage DSS3P8]|nr:hypothetical protein DSS3P8_180 [Roseobacter phage DSS3P8]
MVLGFFFKLAVAGFGVGSLLTLLGVKGNIKDLTVTGMIVMCVSVFISVFAIGGDDEQTADIKAGLCIAQETEMYQPPTVKDSRGNDFQPTPYLRTRYHCPATEFYRDPR